MKKIFFYSVKTFDELGKFLFSVLGFNNLIESETTFNSSGYYFVANVLGLNIKIDENNYDYEDKYNYMITIKKAIGTELSNEESLQGLAEIVASIIASKLEIEVAQELSLRKPADTFYVLRRYSSNGSLVISEDVKFEN